MSRRKHDVLSLVVAAHVGDATPDLRMRNDNPWGGNLLAWWLVMDARVKAMREAAREWLSYGSPWWPADRVTFCQVCCTHSDSMHRAAACASGDRKGRACGDVRA